VIIYGSQAGLLTGLGQLSQAESIYRQALQAIGEGPDPSVITFPALGKINAFYPVYYTNGTGSMKRLNKPGKE